MTTITEADIEAAALDWLASVGWGPWPTGRISPPTRLERSITTTDRWCWSAGYETLCPS